MDIKKTADDVVEHVKKHKEAYIVGALGVLGIVTTIVIMRNLNGSVQNISLGDNAKAAIGYKAVLNNHETTNIVIEAAGNSGNVVMDDKGIVYLSQNKAAEALGVSKSLVSKHLNGKLPDLKGTVLKKVIDGVPEYELVRN